jgi:hypothetical protein
MSSPTTSAPIHPPPSPSRSRWIARLGAGQHSSGAIYGTLVASAVLVTEAKTRDGVAEIVAVVLATLIVYWFAHAYSDLLPQRARHRAAGGKAHALSDLGRALRSEWPIVGGSGSLLAVLLISSALGAGINTAVDIVLWFAVLELAFWGLLAARAAELRGWAVVGYSLGSAVLGLAIATLQVLLH